jgi:hypothetical protein
MTRFRPYIGDRPLAECKTFDEAWLAIADAMGWGHTVRSWRYGDDYELLCYPSFAACDADVRLESVACILTELKPCDRCGQWAACEDDLCSDCQRDSGDCPVCGGSGGGPEHWRCSACGGSGRARP